MIGWKNVDGAALAERFESKLKYLRENLDDAILLRPDMARSWFDIGNDELSLPREHRDSLYEVTRRRQRMTIIFAKAVRFELAWQDLRGGRPAIENLTGYQMPIAHACPPRRLARHSEYTFAYQMTERDIVSTLNAYALYCDEWNARECDRRNPAPGAEQVDLIFHTQPGRFRVYSEWILDVIDVPKSWQPFGPGLTNFRRTPLARSDVRAGWRFVHAIPRALAEREGRH